jgi:hypothetical protein
MKTLICDKCYRVYGCQPTYHPVDNENTKHCITCKVVQHCENLGKSADDFKNSPAELKIKGFCFTCIEKGGGL